MKLNAEFTTEVESFREDQREDQLQIETLLPSFMFPSASASSTPASVAESLSTDDVARLKAELELSKKDFATVRAQMQREIDQLKQQGSVAPSHQNNAELLAFQASLSEAQREILELKQKLAEVEQKFGCFCLFDQILLATASSTAGYVICSSTATAAASSSVLWWPSSSCSSCSVFWWSSSSSSCSLFWWSPSPSSCSRTWRACTSKR